MHGWIVFLVVVGGAFAALCYVWKYSPHSSDPHEDDDPTSFYD